MMKTIIEINNNNYGSTGNIMMNIANKARENGYIVYTCCKNSITGKKYKYNNQIFIGIWLERVISNKLGYLTGYTDHFNYFGTKSFINKLKKIKPNIIHLHNIHGSFINIKMLFKYVKENNIPIVWTFHDIWPITGQCTTYCDCDYYINGCQKCKHINRYPKTLVDKTSKKWKEKKTLFNSIDNLCIVTPSCWLNNLVKNSYMKDNTSIVINNGVDLNKFKPSNDNIKKLYEINDNKFIILGVANYWNDSKGLGTFVKLAKDLDDSFQIILVGTNKEVNSILPNNIISISRTDNIEQLVDLYSNADLLVNPTLMDNFPTVNIESLACGTPVLTYDTGGSKEMLNDKCGISIKRNDYNGLVNKIKYIKNNPYAKEDCIKQANNYNMNDKYNEYINVYNLIINEKK